MYYTILITLTKGSEPPVLFSIDWISHSVAWKTTDVVETHKSVAGIINEMKTIFDTAQFAFELSGSAINDAVWTIISAQKSGELLDIKLALKSAESRWQVMKLFVAGGALETLQLKGKVIDLKPQAGHSYIASFNCTGQSKGAVISEQ